MNDIRLPITYRVTPLYWVGCFFCLIVLGVAGVATEQPLILWLLTLFAAVVQLTMGLRAGLTLTPEGIIYNRGLISFGSFQAFWRQIESVELGTVYNRRSLTGRKVLKINRSNTASAGIIYMGLFFLSADDVSDFLRVLRIKAPQAGIDPKVLAYLD